MRLLIHLSIAAAAVAAAPAAAATQTESAVCRLSLPAAPDAQSFAGSGRDGARAAALAEQTGAVFAAAASQLCAAGVVRPAQLRPYSRLLVRNAEGADSPSIYDDAEEQPGALIIEYAFADGPAPVQAAVEAALRCWRNPAAAGCAVEDVGP